MAQEHIDLATESLRLASEAGDHERQLVYLVFSITAHFQGGDLEETKRLIERFSQLSRELRQPQSHWFPTMFRGVFAMLEKRFDEAEELAHRFLAQAARIQDQNALHTFMIHLLIIRWQQDRMAELIAGIEAHVERYQHVFGWRCGLVFAYTESGLLDAARAQVEHLAAKRLRTIPQKMEWLVGGRRAEHSALQPG